MHRVTIDSECLLESVTSQLQRFPYCTVISQSTINCTDCEEPHQGFDLIGDVAPPHLKFTLPHDFHRKVSYFFDGFLDCFLHWSTVLTSFSLRVDKRVGWIRPLAKLVSRDSPIREIDVVDDSGHNKLRRADVAMLISAVQKNYHLLQLTING